MGGLESSSMLGGREARGQRDALESSSTPNVDTGELPQAPRNGLVRRAFSALHTTDTCTHSSPPALIEAGERRRLSS